MSFIQDQFYDAVADGQYKRVVEMLPFVNSLAERSGALRLAVRCGHTEIVELLIPISNTKESCAWQIAVMYRKWECSALLEPFSDIMPYL